MLIYLIINSIIQLIHIILRISCKLHIAIEVFVPLNHNLQILPSPLICFKIHSLEKWDFFWLTFLRADLKPLLCMLLV